MSPNRDCGPKRGKYVAVKAVQYAGAAVVVHTNYVAYCRYSTVGFTVKK